MDGFKCLPKMKTGGSVGNDDIKQDKKIVKKAFAMHDKQAHEGKKTDLSKLRDGGSVFGGTNAKLGSQLSSEKKFGGTDAKVGSSLSKLCGGGRAMRKGGKAC